MYPHVVFTSSCRLQRRLGLDLPGKWSCSFNTSKVMGILSWKQKIVAFKEAHLKVCVNAGTIWTNAYVKLFINLFVDLLVCFQALLTHQFSSVGRCSCIWSWYALLSS